MSCEIVVGHCGWNTALATHLQISANKRLQLAIQDLIHITNFYAGT